MTGLVRGHPPRQLGRSSLILLSIGLVCLLLGGFSRPTSTERPPDPAPPRVGFTFSPRQAKYLGLNWRETYRASLSLSPNVIRLGAYWDEIEARPGRDDYANLDWLLDEAATHQKQVILTVGMKAPRWPEYYLPAWLDHRLVLPRGMTVSDDPRLRAPALDFVTRVVRRYRDHPAIAYWQVENEPLDPAGSNNWQIGLDFLNEEVNRVRAVDVHTRPVIVNMFVTVDPFGSLFGQREAALARAGQILGLADILGLDVYPSVGVRFLDQNFYFNWSLGHWEEAVLDLRRLAYQAGKDAWIIEAQAEPWEPASLVYTDPAPSQSVQPGLAAGTFQRLQAAGFDNILFWGVEHWYMRLQRHNDSTWWSDLAVFFSGALMPPGFADQPASETRPARPDS